MSSSIQLILNSFGTEIHRKKESFEFYTNNKKVRLEAKELHSLLIAPGIHLTSNAILLAGEYNIDIVILDKNGMPFGRFRDEFNGEITTIRHLQNENSDSDFAKQFIKKIAISKLNSRLVFLKELFNESSKEPNLFKHIITQFEETIKKIEQLNDDIREMRKSIMGYEGSTGAGYWKILGKLPSENFTFSRRSQHPAKDPVNAMMNYSYGILYSKVENACIIAGLDPNTGFLHKEIHNKKALIFDLIEIFRIYAERLVMNLFLNEECKYDMFSKNFDRIKIKKPAKDILFKSFKNFLNTELQYYPISSRTDIAYKIKREETFSAEAFNLADSLIGQRRNNIPTKKEIHELFTEEQ